MHSDIVIRSKNIFTGSELLDGFLVISDGIITRVDNGDGKEYCQETTEYIDASEGLVTPGLVDTHCFFTGLYVNSYGKDLKGCSSVTEIIELISTCDEDLFVGRNTPAELFGSLNHLELPEDIAVVIFDQDNERFVVNRKAASKYDIASGNCNLEMYWKLIEEILDDRQRLARAIKQHNIMLSSNGVTAVKEVIFDDSYGFLDALKSVRQEGDLNLRVSVVSQPVGHDLDIPLGKNLSRTLCHENLRFAGYNMMVDGSMSQKEADLKREYLGTDFHSLRGPEYEKIRELVTEVDRNDFRIALHTQGDRAIAKTIDILSTMKKDDNGKLMNKHTMTDLEFGDPEDFIRMEQLGIIAEIYPQIQSIYESRSEKVAMIRNAVGDDISKIWNRRALQESGTVISCATDLPLLFPNLPESIFHACGGYFQEDETPFQKENTLYRLQLIKAWTTGGAKNLFDPSEKIGCLKDGYHADVVIFDQNLLEVPMRQIREAKVMKTILEGKTVYSR